MEFCPDCKSIMVPSDGVLICRRCGKRLEMKKGDNLVSRTEQKERRMTVIEDSEAAGFPPPSTSVRRVRERHRLLVAPAAAFCRRERGPLFRCTKCNFTWREYD